MNVGIEAGDHDQHDEALPMAPPSGEAGAFDAEDPQDAAALEELALSYKAEGGQTAEEIEAMMNERPSFFERVRDFAEQHKVIKNLIIGALYFGGSAGAFAPGNAEANDEDSDIGTMTLRPDANALRDIAPEDQMSTPLTTEDGRTIVSRSVAGEGINADVRGELEPPATSDAEQDGRMTDETYQQFLEQLKNPELEESDKEQIRGMLEMYGREVPSTQEVVEHGEPVVGNVPEAQVESPLFETVEIDQRTLERAVDDVRTAAESGRTADRGILAGVYGLAAETYGADAGPAEQRDVWQQISAQMNVDELSPSAQHELREVEAMLDGRYEAEQRGVFRR